MARRAHSGQAGLLSPAGVAPELTRRRRRLFLPRFLAEAARHHTLDDEAVERAHAVAVHWADMEERGDLSGESAGDAEFLHAFFGEALGYRGRTQSPDEWELEREHRLPDGQKPDAVLGRFRRDDPPVPRVVIEVKGPHVDLDHDRSNGRTPIQQCWDYLAQTPEAQWGVVTNMVSLRLYHRDHTPLAFEHFTLQELRDSARFREFYCLIERGGLLKGVLKQAPRAERLLKQTGDRQRDVGDELYEAYSHNRLALIHHLHREQGVEARESIRVAQKLLDRIIFIAFCEDRGLLPEKVLDRAYRDIPPFAKVTNPRWRNYQGLFAGVDKGHPSLGLETGYNGGLFSSEQDPAADDLDLDDSWTEFFREIGRYDFRDEVNVEVLGRLFEKSVTELERLRESGLFGAVAPDAPHAPMRVAAMRKRMGIYYTPVEFTTFIVERTVEAAARERLRAVAEACRFDPDDPATDADDAALRRYARAGADALRTLRVCDPACGSGAFLIRAYDALESVYGELIANLRAAGDPGVDDAAERVPDDILHHNLFGVDLSPESIEITQLALWIRSARKGRTLADLSSNIVCGNSLVDDPDAHPQALDWSAAFPEVFQGEAPGFDCVIGNPPWERMKLQEREFFALSAPEIATSTSAAQRRRRIAALETENPGLFERYQQAKRDAERAVRYARQSKRFPLTGKGDVNTYALFAELSRSIVAPTGRVGLLVPSGIASDKTTSEFFRSLMDDGALERFYDFENKAGVFADVHRAFKFAAMIFGGAERRCEAADFVFYAHTMDDLRPRGRHIALSARDLALMNPNTRTCPVFRSRADADLTRRVYSNVPVFLDRTRKEGGNPWGARFFTMFHQTNDAEKFHTADALREGGWERDGAGWRKSARRRLPLYEAKMVQMYDHRAASVVVAGQNWIRQGQTQATTLVEHQNPEFTAEPRWWVDEGEVAEALGGLADEAFLCFKDVTSPTNERTMIASFIPRSAVVNSAPLIFTGEHVSKRRECCLLANLNSMALDFIARQKVGGVHLNFFIVEQLPVLPPEAYDAPCPWDEGTRLEDWIADRVLALSCTADDMRPLAEEAGFGEGVRRWDPEERRRLTAELDGAYFRLFRLDREQVEHALLSFTSASRRDERDFGERRTAREVLDAFDRL